MEVVAQKCPKCGADLELIGNRRMDERVEIIPACTKCPSAFRHPNLGWRILDKEEPNDDK